MNNLVSLKCPVCNEALNKENNSYICTNRHTHDIAKEGYVNLLLAQHKRSKNPGDSEEMIRSRQAFLNKGYYKILSNAIVQKLSSLPQSFEQNILDVGCGEGYYMKGIVDASANSKLYGIDISKSAVKLAGKRKMGAILCVASAYDLPFFDESFSSIVSVFSPVSASELERLLKSDGNIIMVGPAEEHLKGLTAHIYDEVLAHKGNYSVIDESESFVLKEQIEIKEEIVVKQEDILDLLRMTPYYWQITVEKKEKILALSELRTMVHFYVRVYGKVES
jgi:23S rRNA (guanine745-N1)-methyltransferase